MMKKAINGMYNIDWKKMTNDKAIKWHIALLEIIYI